jgi:hypothetical protein
MVLSNNRRRDRSRGPLADILLFGVSASRLRRLRTVDRHPGAPISSLIRWSGAGGARPMRRLLKLEMLAAKRPKGPKETPPAQQSGLAEPLPSRQAQV